MRNAWNQLTTAYGTRSIVLVVAAVLVGSASTAVVRGLVTDPPAANKQVVGQFKPDGTKLEQCRSSAIMEGSALERQKCFEQALGNMVYTQTPEAAIAALEEIETTSKGAIANCHRVAHIMGAAALQRFSANPGRAFTEGSLVCSSGYYHGIIERALLNVPDHKLGAEGNKICLTAKAESNTRAQCYHGMGHGLMLHTRFDMPVSIKACIGMSSVGDQDGCYSGIFMENGSRNYGAKSPWLRSDDLLFPCNNKVVPTAAKRICFSSIAARMGPDVGWDLKKIVPWCHRAPTRYKGICFQNLGELFGEQARYKPAPVYKGCALTGEYEHRCVRGAAGSAIGISAKVEPGLRICRSAPLRVRASCFYTIGDRLGETTEGTVDEIKTTCPRLTQVPAELRQCLRGRKHLEWTEGLG